MFGSFDQAACFKFLQMVQLTYARLTFTKKNTYATHERLQRYNINHVFEKAPNNIPKYNILVRRTICSKAYV